VVLGRQPPNIVFILADDVGYGDLGCYGRPVTDYTTPNLDLLARQGMRFSNAYSASPVCSPTRCSFITGCYPQKFDVGLFEPVTRADMGAALPAGVQTVATLLKSAGYATALVGKWHLGYGDADDPLNHGFDKFYGIRGYAVDYFSHVDDLNNPDLYDGPAPPITETGYMTDLLTDRAVSYLEQAQPPFYLSLHYTAPHWPWEGPCDPPIPAGADWSDPNLPAPNAFRNMMKALDCGVGAVLHALSRRGLDASTLVIFTSDNGGDMPFSNHGGLTGAKGSLYEGGIRVPAIMRWPGVVRAGDVTSQVAVTMDWTATIAWAARKLPGSAIDGDNMLPVTRLSASPWQLMIEHLRSVILGVPYLPPRAVYDRLLFWRYGPAGTGQDAVRSGHWKYLRDANVESLYDLAASSTETPADDVRAANAPTFSTLQTAFSTWDSLPAIKPRH
jgi:arylsulfatase A-like enzyme